MSPMIDDELTLLWQQGTSGEPKPEEVARLSGRASIARFDRVIFWRNSREYISGLMMLPVLLWLVVTNGIGRAYGITALAGVAFVMAYLWFKHWKFKPLDASADARAYQSAMLERIDKQIRLLSSVRYWYLLPLYLPGLWVFGGSWTKNGPVAALLFFAFYTAVFVFIGWLNESWGVRNLRAARAKIEALYED
jgi:hypothetical protein